MSLPWIFLMALSFMWGTSFAMMSEAVQYFLPLQVMASRLVLGAAMLLIIAALYRRLVYLPGAAWQYVGVGLAGNVVPFSLIAWGQLEVSSSVSGAILGSMPLMTALLATVAGIERLSLLRWAGLGLGLVGLLVLALSQEALNGTLLGALAIVGACFSYAVSTLIARSGPDKDSLRAGALTLTCSAVIGSLCMWAVEGLPAAEWHMGWVWIVVLGIFPTGLSGVLYFEVIRMRGPVFLSQVNYFVPVVAFLLGVIALGEPFHWALPTSLVFILGGLYFARQKVAPPPVPPQRVA